MNQHKQYKPRVKAYDVTVEVSYLPFPSEKARDNAYDTHVKLYLRAKERMLKETYRNAEKRKEGGLETAISSLYENDR